MKRELIEGIPTENVVVKIGERTMAITPQAFAMYAEEYGIDGVELKFDCVECLGLITKELEEALSREPVNVRKRRSKYSSENLVFTILGSCVVGIRISQRWNTRLVHVEKEIAEVLAS